MHGFFPGPPRAIAARRRRAAALRVADRGVARRDAPGRGRQRLRRAPRRLRPEAAPVLRRLRARDDERRAADSRSSSASAPTRSSTVRTVALVPRLVRRALDASEGAPMRRFARTRILVASAAACASAGERRFPLRDADVARHRSRVRLRALPRDPKKHDPPRLVRAGAVHRARSTGTARTTSSSARSRSRSASSRAARR